ncbi:MAG: short-chain dehydrogenase/reductase [Acidobacteriales bacterium]|nr:short-chain dehydrogenase/reductase [Terriglobales bacterium]
MAESSGAFLKGKHAIVTGGSRGIGAAIASELARAGANLTVMGRTAAALQSHAAQLSRDFGVKVEPIACDVSNETSIRNAFESAQKALGEAYILINNAGQSDAAEFVDTKRDLWDRMIAVNLTGTFLCSQQVLPAMLKSKTGRLINIASTAGLKGYSQIAAYSAAKHGVVGLTRSLAAETAKLGITVNAVCPGYTDTEMSRAAVKNLMAAGKTEDEAYKMITRTMPRGTLIQPEEVANAVLWLCSPHASAITGQTIAVAGGEVS